MQDLRPGRFSCAPRASLIVAAATALVAGCASPGPPRAPSLGLPQLVSDLAASRSGDLVELHFTAPERTTDGQPLRADTLTGGLCRQLGSGGTCAPVALPPGEATVHLGSGTAGSGEPVMWTDSLPAALRTGPPRLIGYRVELIAPNGRSAGYSEAVYTLAGEAPPPVLGLAATGTRLGVMLRWQPAPAGTGQVLVQRTRAAGASPEAARETGSSAHERQATGAHEGGSARRDAKRAGEQWLVAAAGGSVEGAMLDTGVAEGVPYTYLALRDLRVELGGRNLELRSAPSPAVSFTWRDVYPPPAPTGLTALGYAVPAPAGAAAGMDSGGFAVDLIWQPVNDPRLAGYIVSREALNAAGESAGAPVQLNASPVLTPGFHDATAKPDGRYRYRVTAIDARGNRSGAAEAIVAPQ